MTIGRFLVLLSIFLALPLSASAELVDCGNGVFVFRTPFNQNDPCGQKTVFEEPTLPGFKDLFGERPTGPSTTETRISQVEWDQDKRLFGGLVEPPGVKGFDAQKYQKSLEAFFEYGLGEPMFWSRLDTNGKLFQVYAGFPGAFSVFADPPFVKKFAHPWTVFQAPHVVIASFQIDAIRRQIYVEKVHPFVPDVIRRENRRIKPSDSITLWNWAPK